MTYNTPDLLEKTPLTKFLVESKEEFKNSDVWFDISVADGTMRIDPRKHSLFIDSLITRAYELGQQNPKVGFLRQYLNESTQFTKKISPWTDEGILTFLRIPFSGKALDSAIGEAELPAGEVTE